jgi:hypothetical protein
MTPTRNFIKVISRASTLTLGLALLTTLAASKASAGCGSYDPHQPRFYNPASSTIQTPSDPQESDGRHPDGGNSIVGLWKVLFTATDGSGYTDFGYSQWHSDGTEFLNSGSRAPATQNFCLGVWQKTGESIYKLNHFALSYDLTTGVLNGKVNIREKVWLGPDGNTYSGTFTIDIYDPTGAILVAHVAGKISGSRITLDTLTP